MSPDQLVIETVSRERLSDSVSRKLKQLIVDQSLRMGDELPSEGELASRFGVSKSVIREALRELNAMGIIELQQGKLATVCDPSSEPLLAFLTFASRGTKKGLQEAIEVRRMMETETAALAAERITDEELACLDAEVAKLRRSLEDVDPWTEADLAFHSIIARSARNSLLLYMIEALTGLFREMIRVLHLQRALRDSEATLMRHVRIVEALRAHDAAAARKMMSEHFDATIPVLMAMKEDDKGRIVT